MPQASREADPAAVPEELAGKPLDAIVRALFAVSWGEARSRIETGKVSVDGVVRTNEQTRVREGSVVAIRMSAPRPRSKEGSLPDEAIVYFDAQVVVVDKPAGVSTVPFEEG